VEPVGGGLPVGRLSDDLPAVSFEGADQSGAGDDRQAGCHAGSGSLRRTTPVSSGRPSSRRPSTYSVERLARVVGGFLERAALRVGAGEVGGVHVVAALLLGFEDELDLPRLRHTRKKRGLPLTGRLCWSAGPRVPRSWPSLLGLRLRTARQRIGMPPSMVAPPLPGTVRPGTASGATSSARPRTNRSAAVAYVIARPNGTVFSSAIRAATNAIQARLITPSANSDAIRAQQQPTHQAPCRAPMLSAPHVPPRQELSRKPSGLRHLPRQTSFIGVSSYAAASMRMPPASQRPAASQASSSPSSPSPSLKMP